VQAATDTVEAPAAAGSVSALTESNTGAGEPEDGDEDSSEAKEQWYPPAAVWRPYATILISGQVIARILSGRIHWRNLREQISAVGPRTIGVVLLTSCFVGMVFTIQFVREFARLGLTRSVGGVLALAFARELSPVICAVILAGRVGSAFAAELGTMQVSEQTDSMRVLRTDPVDYLVTPRALACLICQPILTVFGFCVGLAASTFLADLVYGIPPHVILESAQKALIGVDIINMLIKAASFGTTIAVISCGCGMTTRGGAKVSWAC